MRKIASTSAVLLLVWSSVATAQCTGGRYHDLVFPGNPVVTYNVNYGSNLDQNGATVQLMLDVYEPACDVATNRPLIVFAHGGGFVSGDKQDAGYVQTAVALAQLGYVVASINYRLGFPTTPPAGLYGFNSAVIRGLHDARAAVRFMRNNAQNGNNTWRVDPNNIFFGGVSAGGIIALHLAYQNTAGEMTLDCGNQPGTNQTSVEGLSNSIPVSSSVKAVISISGAISNTNLNWITTNDIPVFMAHGTVDGTVPYGSSYFYPPLQLFPIHGSSSIAARCVATGTKYCFKPMYGQDHVPSNPAYVDTIATLMRNFLEHFTCSVALNCSHNGSPTIAAASVSIAITAGSNPTCSGSSVTFTATPVNGGTAPTYQWKKGSSIVGTGSTFTSASLVQGDVITCVMTPTAGCGSAGSATSNAITMSVTAGGAAGVTIALTTGSNPTCTGESLTFTATPTNGGSAPSYQWKKNTTNAGTGSTYTSATLANGDVITCSMTSNSSCASPNTATSNAITVSVGASVAPTVTIALTTGSNPACPGESLTFTATSTNGGASPAYQWKKNGTNVATGNTYTTTSLANHDMITCVLTSNSSCANPINATSNSIMVMFSASVAPSVAIAITAGTNPSCTDAPVTFTATGTNGGASPLYEWKINNTNAGLDDTTFTVSALEDGDEVTCMLTSNAVCATPASITSNVVTMTVHDVPAISQNGNVLTSSPASSYQWYRNGQIITGATSQFHTATVNGSYTVKGDGDCESETVVVTLTSIIEKEDDEFFIVYPNPNEGSFTVLFSDVVHEVYQLRLSNAAGAVVYQQIINSSNQLDISHLGKGVYFLTLLGEKKMAVKKLVVY